MANVNDRSRAHALWKRCEENGYGVDKAQSRFQELKQKAKKTGLHAEVDQERMALEWLESEVVEFEFDQNNH